MNTEMSVCTIEGCGRQHAARGFCASHYIRFKRHGDPLGGSTGKGAALAWLEAHKDYAGDECLIWPFATLPDGRGKITNGKKTQLASRIICEHRHGPPPTPQHQAAHSCGKGHLGCTHPQHLSWKTPKENKADQVLHGTDPQGERNGAAKLTVVDVLTIRAVEGVTHSELAAQYGVSRALIGMVKQHKVWSHVP